MCQKPFSLRNMDMSYLKQISSKINKLIDDDDGSYMLFIKDKAVIKNEVYERIEGSWIISKDKTIESVLSRVGLTNENSKEDIVNLIREKKTLDKTVEGKFPDVLFCH